MKKLLSLLSVLTISGTAVPTTIAASPYQKEEKLNNNNNNNNYQETSNLEKLNRNKRADNYEECIGITAGAAAGTQTAVGAAAGAAIGSVVPGIGTLIGAGIGALVGGAAGGGIGAGAAAAGCQRDTYLDSLNLNKNLGIIDDDDDNTILNEMKKLNQSLNINNLYIIEKTDISAKIVASKSSIYKTNSNIVIKYLIRRNLTDTSLLLKNWSDNFNSWKNEIERQVKEDVPVFSLEQKRTWTDDKKFQIRSQFHSLAQNIFIIKNDSYIKRLYNRIQSLESDLNFLKNKIEELGSNSPLSLCGSVTNAISVGSNFVPVVGNVVSFVTSLVSASCFLANEFN